MIMSLQLERHLRRVDQDLSRFTIELEADTAGITETLEQSKCLCCMQFMEDKNVRSLPFVIQSPTSLIDLRPQRNLLLLKVCKSEKGIVHCLPSLTRYL